MIDGYVLGKIAATGIALVTAYAIYMDYIDLHSDYRPPSPLVVLGPIIGAVIVIVAIWI